VRLGLVLSGGGARGAFEAGVVAAVEDAGLRPTILSGTSAGALNAAGLAAGFDAARLAELWGQVTSRDVFRLRRDVWRLPRPSALLERGRGAAARLLHSIGWTWVMDTTPLRRTLVDALGGEAVDVDPDLVLAVSAVDVATGRLIRYASAAPPPERVRKTSALWRVGPVDVHHLMASAAIPLLFRPHPVAGHPHWDGGIVANTPLAPAMAFEPDAVVVVTTSTLERPAPRPRSFGEAAGLLIDTVLRHSLDQDLARARVINTLCRAAPQEVSVERLVDLLLIEPVGLALGDSLRFDPAEAARMIRLGREAGARALEGWPVLT
jgi:NTE family protein